MTSPHHRLRLRPAEGEPGRRRRLAAVSAGQGDRYDLAQRGIADPDLGAALVVHLDADGLLVRAVAPQAGHDHRLVMKDLLPAKVGIVFRFAGRHFKSGDSNALGIWQAELEFIAVQVIIGRNDPASFDQRGIQRVDGKLECLIGGEDALPRSATEAVE
ncbi:MAG: hypothetical protein IPP10_13930 [Candidatus Competibacteraceae bacterium]|nr:hypothetical protein [Candidatus Competibacteraceae bacterium]